MKFSAMLLALAVTLASAAAAPAKDVQVKGYTKKDGTVVKGYTKTVKDKPVADTQEVKGYTKKDGTVVKGYSRKKAAKKS